MSVCECEGERKTYRQDRLTQTHTHIYTHAYALGVDLDKHMLLIVGIDTNLVHRTLFTDPLDSNVDSLESTLDKLSDLVRLVGSKDEVVGFIGL